MAYYAQMPQPVSGLQMMQGNRMMQSMPAITQRGASPVNMRAASPVNMRAASPISGHRDVSPVGFRPPTGSGYIDWSAPPRTIAPPMSSAHYSSTGLSLEVSAAGGGSYVAAGHASPAGYASPAGSYVPPMQQHGQISPMHPMREASGYVSPMREAPGYGSWLASSRADFPGASLRTASPAGRLPMPFTSISGGVQPQRLTVTAIPVDSAAPPLTTGLPFASASGIMPISHAPRSSVRAEVKGYVVAQPPGTTRPAEQVAHAGLSQLRDALSQAGDFYPGSRQRAASPAREISVAGGGAYVRAASPAGRADRGRAASPAPVMPGIGAYARAASPVTPLQRLMVSPVQSYAGRQTGASQVPSPIASAAASPNLQARVLPLLPQQRSASPLPIRNLPTLISPLNLSPSPEREASSSPILSGVQPVVPVPAGPIWGVDQTCQIGRDRDEVMELVGRFVKLLDMDQVMSVSQAVGGLNDGSITCQEQCCIVFSRNSKGYYLLYRKGGQDVALDVLQTVQAKAKGKHQVLQVGAVVRIGEHDCRITGPLGKGSFGIVWAAEIQESPTWKGPVAVKEMQCNTRQGASAQAREGELLYDLIELRSQRFGNGNAPSHDAFGMNPLDKVPALVAVETKNIGTDSWRVRLAMTRVPGIPLDRFLEQRKIAAAKLSPRRRFAEACDLALELLEQLVPTFEIMSEALLHRDVNAHNILVHELEDDPADQSGKAQQYKAWGWRRPRLRFGLVDFGLAVRRSEWDGPMGPSSWHLVDIGGDCRYWPMCAWLQFECGCEELSKYPQLATEYQAQLDLHALGVTALQIIAASLSPDAGPNGAAQNASRALPAEFAAVKESWDRYWEDATEYWERLLNVFRNGGDQFALKASCIETGVHNIVGARLASLRAALRDAEVCGQQMGNESIQGELAADDDCAHVDEALRCRARPLLSGLLELVSAGGVVGIEEKTEPSSWQAVSAAISA